MQKPTQLVLIDESGDPGFKVGSSPFFVIVFIVFNDFLEAEKVSVEIKQLRRKLLGADNREFKFNQLIHDKKITFFERISKFDFLIRALVVEKDVIKSEELKRDKASFYNYFVKTLLKYNDGSITNASVKIDGSGDREFQRELKSYLNRELGSKSIKKLRAVDSKGDVLIQLADMIAGCIRRKFEIDKDKDGRVYKFIAKKLGGRNLWIFK